MNRNKINELSIFYHHVLNENREGNRYFNFYFKLYSILNRISGRALEVHRTVFQVLNVQHKGGFKIFSRIMIGGLSKKIDCFLRLPKFIYRDLRKL